MDGIVPEQLSRATAHFVNRSAELATLDRILDEHRSRPVLVVISGPGGIGKSELAHRWAEHAKARFPRGQLEADLGAFNKDGRVDPAELLGQFLRALGVEPAAVPIGLTERIAMYRTLTARRPLLVLLHDAADAAQVTDLVPAAPTSIVVVTSRHRLGALNAKHDTRPIYLDPFETRHGVELLRSMLGSDTVTDADPDVKLVVERCAGWPLAVAAVGAQLAVQRFPSFAGTADELQGSRRRAAENEDEKGLSVSAALEFSYRKLPADAAALYVALAQHPGPDFGVGVASAAVDRSQTEARRLLIQLAEASLLNDKPGERYEFHDLVREHAEEKARELGTDEPRAAWRRIVEWYLRAAQAAEDHLTTPDQDRIPYEFAFPLADSGSLPPPERALAWLETERLNLIAAINSAERRREPELAWQLAAAMWPLFLLHKHYRDFVTVSQLGVKVAAKWGNPLAEALMHNRWAAARRATGLFDDAVKHYTAARDVLPEGVGEVLALRSVEGLGLVALARRDLDEAAARFTEVLDLADRLNREHDAALALVNLGVTLTDSGNATEAVGRLERAVELLTEHGNEYNVARARTGLGRALTAAGRTAEAEEHLTAALEVMRASGSQFEEARAMHGLGDLAEATGDAAEARRLHTEALAIYEKLGRPEAGPLREQLERAQIEPS
ncbi:tetratricopeptide repeat protein [Amycolatopsis suaedae]|uniref:Tetratricopeptide repeat protein n=1 Tax=Amycolatopsis suaedae TaxID=2510978 RepID=A0A4V2ELN3_9PSEU|nr:tetratricopeptide repeat protein [Amycolatopsis suaedae]RZQ62165.1 tetratricopeptide repeat protein [Amycolatopsis suaedae]